ncbi:MAG TPA: hypothetical protein VGP17_04525 [Solirubrobacteraceae bacterium]|jgi:hypothetical protein|nr:hypothetical protein [Solirubrobacteraceae bacterium]
MRGLRTASILLGAVLAVALTASPAAALSTNNLQWHRCEKGASGPKFKDSACTESLMSGEFGEGILGLSETREFKAKAVGAQVMEVDKEAIRCKGFSVASGAKVIGAGSEELSGAEATVNYEECEVVGFPSCEINKAKAGSATISTKPLTAIVAYASRAGAEKEEGNAVIVLAPKELTEEKKVLSTITLAGSCPFTTGKFNIEGELAFEDVSGAKHLLELELSASSSPITKAYDNSGKSTHELSIVVPKFLGLGMTYTGNGVVSLPSPVVWWLFH